MSGYSNYTIYRLTKNSRLWRFVATMLAFALVTSLVLKNFDNTLNSPYIAEIAIDGMIIDSQDEAKKIRELINDDNIKAVIVAVNSPGGTTYDSEILYDSLKALAKKKHIVTYMKNVAASGGYVVALSGEKIYAAKNTITGSIGVLMQAPNASELLKNIGIKITEIKSSPIKGEPNYFSETPPEALENLHAMVQDTNQWFQEIVKENRPQIKPQEFSKITNGSVFTGRQAVDNKLVDAIGDQLVAKQYLISRYKLDTNIEVKEVPLTEEVDVSLIEELATSSVQAISRFLLNNSIKSTNHVDGLLSLWHI